MRWVGSKVLVRVQLQGNPVACTYLQALRHADLQAVQHAGRLSSSTTSLYPNLFVDLWMSVTMSDQVIADQALHRVESPRHRLTYAMLGG